MTERLLAVTLDDEKLRDEVTAWERLLKALCRRWGVVEVRELPRPANEALGDAAEWHEMYAATQREAGDAKLSDRAMEQYYRTAQWHSDLADQLRAMAVGPMAEDYEAAIADVLQNPRYTHEDDIEAMVGTLADVRNRARKLARERSES